MQLVAQRQKYLISLSIDTAPSTFPIDGPFSSSASLRSIVHPEGQGILTLRELRTRRFLGSPPTISLAGNDHTINQAQASMPIDLSMEGGAGVVQRSERKAKNRGDSRESFATPRERIAGGCARVLEPPTDTQGEGRHQLIVTSIKPICTFAERCIVRSGGSRFD